MIPLRTNVRVLQSTPVSVGLIVANVLVFLYEFFSLSTYGQDRFSMQWGLVPDHWSLLTILTSMFIHGGWLHIGGNMLFLWVFGRNIEDLIGSGQFLAFYLLCGFAAGAAQVFSNPSSPYPMVGASGAIAGVMGAYLVKFPRSSVDSLLPLLIFYTRIAIPAPLLLLYWFGMQFFYGFASLGTRNYMGGGGVAYFAHIGGFVAGILLIFLFPARQRWRSWYDNSV